MSEKFRAAKAYYRQGNYRKARQLLRQIDHPEARKVLDRLERQYPRPVLSVVVGVSLSAASLIIFCIAIYGAVLSLSSPGPGVSLLFLIIGLPIAYGARKGGKRLRE